MTELKTEIEKIIYGLDATISASGIDVSSINSAIRVMEWLSGLGPNLVGLSEEDFESMLLKAIKGVT